MSEQHESQPFGCNICHICGGTDFEWGKFRYSPYVKIIAEDENYITARFFNMGADPSLRICTTCRNVQMFILDADK